MPGVLIEFTIEPFVDAHPGEHVLAAWAAVNDAGCELRTGPFSSTVSVEQQHADQLVSDIVRAALAAGATRIELQVEVEL
jgi:uncharacterized protein YqgV (UPF0045/DUF77 family)